MTYCSLIGLRLFFFLRTLLFRFISNVVCNHLPALHLRRRLHFCNVGNTLCEAYQKFGPKLLVCYFAPLEYDCRFDFVSLFEKSAGMPHFEFKIVSICVRMKTY